MFLTMQRITHAARLPLSFTRTDCPARSLQSRHYHRLCRISTTTQSTQNATHTALCYRYYTPTGGAGSFLGDADTVTPDPVVAVKAAKGMSSMVAAGRKLSVTTWNVAAINNNPFEYWITYTDKDHAQQYDDLMVNVQDFIENPADKDLPVHQVFTDAMFQELNDKLTTVEC